MILTKFVEVTIINHNFHHYKNLGYDVKCKKKFIIPIEHLTKGSHIRIDVSCDICCAENNIKYLDYNHSIEQGYHSCSKCRNIKYKKTCLYKYGVENTSSLQEIKDKRTETIQNRYGVDNIFQLKETKEKSKKTCLEKYGAEYSQQTEKFQKKNEEVRIKNGNQIHPDKLKEFEKYRISVNKITYKYKKKLYSDWTGYDYYDNEYIKENFNYNSNNKQYPTIDHKISIYYGYSNNISHEEIVYN